MSKYKPGDRVRVRPDLKQSRYPMADGSASDTATCEMLDYAGKMVTINEISFGRYRIAEDRGKWAWTDGMFSSAEQPIVIYAKGRKVFALDKNTGRKAEAKCSPEDVFDFYTGARLAFDRLTTPFEPGDLIIGLPEADNKYSVTKTGWVGMVVGIYDNEICVVGRSDGPGGTHEYTVEAKYFRKLTGKDL